MPTLRSGLIQFAPLAGAKELERTLKELGSSRDIRLTQKAALKISVQPFVEAARRLAPYDSSPGRDPRKLHLRDQIRVGERTRDRRNQERESIVSTIYVGLVGKNVGVIDEFGTGPRFTKGQAKSKQLRGGGTLQMKSKKYGPGAARGMRKATPFMRPAWEQTKNIVLDRYGSAQGQAIEKTAARIAKRNARR